MVGEAGVPGVQAGDFRPHLPPGQRPKSRRSSSSLTAAEFPAKLAINPSSAGTARSSMDSRDAHGAAALTARLGARGLVAISRGGGFSGGEWKTLSTPSESPPERTENL